MLAALLLLSVQFVDVAETAGLAFTHVSGGAAKDYTLEVVGGGVAWIDYDRDGWLDLYFTNAGRWEDLERGRRSVSNALFRNNGDGTFSRVEAGMEGTGWGMGATAADFDNDGWTDLYVCQYGANVLYRNNGDGSFTDVTARSGIGGSAWSSSAAFADYDGDGWLDLYVTNYVLFDHRRPPPPRCQYRGMTVHCGPKGMIAVADVLYRSNGDGTFSDVTHTSGVGGVVPSYGLGVLWSDLDEDGDQDLYVANDSMANFLFENLGDGTFREIALLSGSALSEDGNAQAGMGLASADYDRDGRMDIFVTNFSDDYNTLYRNKGSLVFQDVSYAAGIAFAGWQRLGWGTHFIDYDNDGWQDLFVSNGHIYPQVDEYEIGTRFHQGKLLFRNLGNGKFQEVTADLGPALTGPWSSRGSAAADYDNDGDLDIAVNNLDDRPSLFRNRGGAESGRWLSLSLEGVRSNRGAVGSRVVVETDGGRQVREVRAGASFQAGDDPRVHFGVGNALRVRTLKVHWPGGETQEFGPVSSGRRYRLREGGELETIR